MLDELKDLFHQALVFDWRMHTKEDVDHFLENWDEAEARVRKKLHLPIIAHWYVLDGCAYCSNCRNNFKKAIMSQVRFCPRCGAQMEGAPADG